MKYTYFTTYLLSRPGDPLDLQKALNEFPSVEEGSEFVSLCVASPNDPAVKSLISQGHISTESSLDCYIAVFKKPI